MKSSIKKRQLGERIKLARIQVKVPVRHPGNVIGQVEVKCKLASSSPNSG